MQCGAYSGFLLSHLDFGGTNSAGLTSLGALSFYWPEQQGRQARHEETLYPIPAESILADAYLSVHDDVARGRMVPFLAFSFNYSPRALSPFYADADTIVKRS